MNGLANNRYIVSKSRVSYSRQKKRVWLSPEYGRPGGFGMIMRKDYCN